MQQIHSDFLTSNQGMQHTVKVVAPPLSLQQWYLTAEVSHTYSLASFPDFHSWNESLGARSTPAKQEIYLSRTDSNRILVSTRPYYVTS